MNDTAFVVGVGMTKFGKHLDKSIKDLTRVAVEGALADAGCDASQVQVAFFSNCTQGHFEGQHMVRGEIALRAMGIQKIPIVNVENACASASTAFHLAAIYVRSGAADIALAVGAEKMLNEDKALMFSAFDAAWDVHTVEQNKAGLLNMGHGIVPPPGPASAASPPPPPPAPEVTPASRGMQVN